MEKEKNTILVVDDSMLNQEFLSTIFGDTYNLLKATNGTQALEVMRENAKIIDVVLLDIVMPGMDGYEVLQVMGTDEDLKFLPVIVITAESDVKSELKAFQLGAVDFIVRPFNSRLVLQRVSSVLHKRQLENMRTEFELLKKDAENEKIISMMMNNAPGGVSMLEREKNGTYNFLYCTNGMAELFKYPDYVTCLSELSEKPFCMLDEGTMEMLDTQIQVALENNHPVVESTFCCKAYNGEDVWVMLKAQVTNLGDGKAQIYFFVTDITKEKKYENELKANAYQDPLTGMYNRNAFYANAGRQITEDKHSDYSVLRLNVGGFKLINDILGREMGDKLLMTIADSLRRIAPRRAIYARYHADNFVMLVPSIDLDPEMFHCEIVADINKVESIKHDIQIYIGIYKAEDKDVSVEVMCDRAGIACQSINGSYSTHIAYYDEKMRQAMVEEQEIRDETRRAIDNGEFVVFYQPVYGIKAKRFVSAEALVRWNHPTKGMISPGKFIPVFERNGFIAELDIYVLEQVCKYHQKRRENGLEPFPISVNISRMSLYNPQLFDIIAALTESYGIESKYFRIEITETAYNDNPAQLLETVNKLRAKGFPVLMDDFGSGYSSLNTLKDIPIDLLKLDMKFMQGFESSERVKTIVTSVARMSRWLNVPMLAEGVETKEQYLFLKSIGCSYIQGYYFSKPTPEREFTETIGSSGGNSSDYKLSAINTAEDINLLLDSNSFVSTLLGEIFDGYAIYEVNGDRLDVIRINDGYTRITGLDSDDVAAEDYNILDKFHEEDKKKVQKGCAECFVKKGGVRAVLRIYNTHGDMVYIDTLFKRLGGTDENPIFCIAVTDVTSQMTADTTYIAYYNIAQDDLRERADGKYPHCTVLEFDHTTNTTIITPTFSMFAADELMNKDEMFEEKEYMKAPAIHPDDRGEYKEFLQSAYKQDSGTECVLRLQMADRSYKWCRLFLYFDKDEKGKIRKSICTINVVHDEIMSKKKLEQTMNMLDKAVRNIPVGVGILKVEDGKAIPVYTSDQIFNIFAADRGADNKSGHVNIAIDFPRNALSAGCHGDTTRLTYKEDGTPFWLNTRYNVAEEDGELMVYAALDDVSEKVEFDRRQTVQEQIYQLLLEESRTIIFDYNTESDVLTYYPWATQSEDGTRTPVVVNDFKKNSLSNFEAIEAEYREPVREMIDNLSAAEGTEELPMRLNTSDGREKIWFRCLCKSISDEDGNVFRIIGKLEDVDDEVTQMNLVREKAKYDALCVDIYNKATTEDLIRKALERNTKGSLLMLDIDDFKSINDSLGHLFGDEFLKTFATKLKSVFRGTDIVGRYGGDEFIVFLNHADPALAKKKAETVLQQISTIEVPEIGNVKSSIGITISDSGNSDYIHLIKQADSALYQAKNNGKNCVVMFERESMDETSYRVSDTGSDTARPMLSSNPNSFSSLIMRVFSALYSSADMQSGIDRMLKLVGETFDVSRVYIFENSDDDLHCSNTFEWCAEGAQSQMGSLQNLSYEDDLDGSYHENWNEDGIFYCHDITSLEGSQREILERQGVKSVLQCSILEDGKFRGFVGFDEYRSNRFWTQEQVDALAFIAKVLSTFLLKERNKRISEKFSKSIESILDYHPSFVYVIEPETHKLLYLNSMAQEAVGSDKIGSPCYDVVCGDSKCPECPVRDYEKNGEGRSVNMILPALKKIVKARTYKIEWKGKQAQLIICVD